ncbi:unnamed protein product [Durusdinium trenchii]|uniref:Uncharacterized protein n=1 Tax=Durusdinium trenchii TaxID=1381693 RepID=A0ABP0SAH7_9DINO
MSRFESDTESESAEGESVQVSAMLRDFVSSLDEDTCRALQKAVHDRLAGGTQNASATEWLGPEFKSSRLEEIFQTLEEVEPVVKASNMAHAMRLAGLDPTASEVCKVLENIGKLEILNLDSFTQVMQEVIEERYKKNEARKLLRSCRSVDPEKSGLLPQETLVQLMHAQGITFSDELQDILNDVPSNSQGFNYEVLISLLFTKVDDDMFESKQNEQNVEAEKLKEVRPSLNFVLKEGAVVHPEEGKVLVRAMATGVLEWYNPDTKTLLGSMPVHSSDWGEFIDSGEKEWLDFLDRWPNLMGDQLQALDALRSSATGLQKLSNPARDSALYELVKLSLCPQEDSPYQVIAKATQAFLLCGHCDMLPEAAPVVPDYDLTDPMDLANFFSFANIRLLRGAFIKHLAKEKLGLPRRQEAEQASCGSQTALVTHEEVKGWAADLKAGKERQRIFAISHVWPRPD